MTEQLESSHGGGQALMTTDDDWNARSRLLCASKIIGYNDLVFLFMMRIIVSPGPEFTGKGNESLMLFVHRTRTVTNLPLLTATHLNTGMFSRSYQVELNCHASPALNPI